MTWPDESPRNARDPAQDSCKEDDAPPLTCGGLVEDASLDSVFLSAGTVSGRDDRAGRFASGHDGDAVAGERNILPRPPLVRHGTSSTLSVTSDSDVTRSDHGEKASGVHSSPSPPPPRPARALSFIETSYRNTRYKILEQMQVLLRSIRLLQRANGPPAPVPKHSRVPNGSSDLLCSMAFASRWWLARGVFPFVAAPNPPVHRVSRYVLLF